MDAELIVTTSHPIMDAFADRGFLLQAVFDIEELQRWATDPLLESWPDARTRGRLILLGQAGPSVWEAMIEAGIGGPDRLDDYSTTVVAEEFAARLPDERFDIVYPSEALVPLGRLAELAGWGTPSPLGITIHAEFGPWIAHRVVFLTDADIAPTRHIPIVHPCDSCTDKPCIAACPASAVRSVKGLDLVSCGTYRTLSGSDCALQCLARNSCPVGASYQYGTQQMAHHYASGLASIRAHSGGST